MKNKIHELNEIQRIPIKNKIHELNSGLNEMKFNEFQ
jgi:hypothetical protein